MIKRKSLPADQSKMYVYPQDVVDKWKKEIEIEKHKKIMQKKEKKSQSEFDRLYIAGEGTFSDLKENEQK